MRNLFHLTRSERRGLYALSIILIILLIVKLSIPYWPFKKIEEFDVSIIESKIDSLEKSNLKLETVKTSSLLKDSLFYFDPNKLNNEGWQHLGLSKKRADIIINYRKKGGKFYYKEDLKKVYSIDSQFYAKVSPFIKISNPDKKTTPKTTSNKTEPKHTKKDKIIIINLNTCNEIDLQKINGIGPTYSKRIIKYRDLLGGFTNKNQLLEVYGISQEILETIQTNISIDTLKIKQININTDEIKSIAKHPYINWNLAKLIVNYKLKHGKYTIKEELLNLELIDTNTFIKILPYVKL